MAVNKDNRENRENGKRTEIIFWLLLICIMAAGGILFVKTTPNGVGLVSDSVNYINGARSIADGNGYFRESGGGTLKPITNFPPLYSILLSVPLFFGADWIKTVWSFSLIFYVLNLGLIGLLVRKSMKNTWLGIAAALLLMASKPFLYFQVFAMSEPLFFFCTLMAFLLFFSAKETGRQAHWFFCGIFCGLAFLTRYVGIVSLCAVLAAFLLDLRGKSGWKSVFSVLLGAIPLISAWLIRNIIVSGNALNREAFFHPSGYEDFNTGVLIFWRWLFPIRYGAVEQPVYWMRWGILGLGIIGLVYLIFRFIKTRRDKNLLSPSAVLSWVYGIYILGYLAFIVITISLFDASVNIEERIIYPAFLILILIFFSLFKWIIERKKWFLTLMLVGIYGLFLFNFSQDTVKFIPKFSTDGYGWAWEGWRTSPAMEIIRELPAEKVIYSNQPEAVSLWAGRGSYALLDPIDPSSNLPREGYAETMNTIRSQVLDGESVLVFFGIESWIEADSENWITELCDGLPMIYQDTSEWVVGKGTEQ